MMSDFETIIKPTIIKQSNIKVEKDPLDPNEFEYYVEYQEQKPSESELENATVTYMKISECVEHQDRKPSESELENASTTYTQCVTTGERLCIKNEIESVDPSENQHNSFSNDDISINNLTQQWVPNEEIKQNKSTQELKTEQVKFSEKELEKLRRLATAAERTRRSLPTYKIDRRDTMIYYLTMKGTNESSNQSEPKTVAGRLDCKPQPSSSVESTKFRLVPSLKRSSPVESTKFSVAPLQQLSSPVGTTKLSTVHFQQRSSPVETSKLSPAPSTVKQYRGRIYGNKSPLVWIE